MINIFEKRKTAFVGMDMHKDQHTAVIIDCWCNILATITIENKPSKFDKFIDDVRKVCRDLNPVFGLEDTRGYGRNLAVYLVGRKFTVKHVNPAYTTAMRKSSPMSKKDDDFDSFCVARILRDMINELPDAVHEDIFWTIRQLVNRRDNVTRGLVRAKNQLHTHLMYSYPSYRKLFHDIDCKSALAFFDNYPSPMHLENTNEENVLKVLKEVHKSYKIEKVRNMLEIIKNDGDTKKDYQEERDFIAKKIIEEIKFRHEELESIDDELKKLIPETGYKLETLTGISTVTASHLISEIGDINRFPNADKLAKFCGLAPVCFSSAGKGKDERCRQGNRKLNSIFHFLAIALVQVSKDGTPRQPIFRAYFERRIKEGKSKPQALVCIARRTLRIVYGMMKNKTEYKPFEGKDINCN